MHHIGFPSHTQAVNTFMITNLDSVHPINHAIFAILINDINKYLLMMRTQLLITCDTIRYTHHILLLTTRTFVLRIHKLSIAAMVKNVIMLMSIRQCIILEIRDTVNNSILFWMSISENPSERLHTGNANFLPPGRFLDTQVQYRKRVCTYTHGSLKMNYQ